VRTADDIFASLVNRLPAQFKDPMSGTVGPNVEALLMTIAAELAEMAKPPMLVMRPSEADREEFERAVAGLVDQPTTIIAMEPEAYDLDRRLRRVEAALDVTHAPDRMK
jgi:hypothetical protein